MMAEESEWHGWSRDGVGAIHVGPLPGRKSICVYTIQGSVLNVHAYCRNEEDAKSLLDFLDRMIR